MDKRIKHSKTINYQKPPEYNAWVNMKARCSRTSGPDFPNYLGRGITVCDEWKRSFEQFLADMGPRPSPWHSVERKDNSLGYSKSNCVWATREVQSKNQRTRKDNSSGLRGVSRLKTGHWLAEGSRNGKRDYLYYGVDFFEACCARKTWEKT